MSQTITTVSGGTLTVRGVDVHVTEIEHVSPQMQTEPCMVPNPRWSATDSHGHEHRWWLPAVRDGRRSASELQTPTLTKSFRHIDCDDSCGNWDCEGYDVEVWHCIACADEVHPGFESGSVTFETRPGFVRLTVETTTEDALDGEMLRREPATLRYPSGPGQMTIMNGELWETGARTGRQCVDGPVVVTRAFDFRT